MKSRKKTEVSVTKKFELARIAQTANGEVRMGEMVFLGQHIQLGQLKFGGKFIDEGLEEPDGHLNIVGTVRSNPAWWCFLDNHLDNDFGRPIQQGYQFVELGYNQ